MKISIWQQFSSNHSSSFTVVGEFETAEKANESANTIMAILEDIKASYIEHKEHPRVNLPPTAIEKKYGEMYGFDWKERLDWVDYNLDLNNNAQYIPFLSTYDRLVIIESTPSVYTWQTGHQMANLLTGMGANVVRKVTEGIDPDEELKVWMVCGFKIECEVENKAKAHELTAHFQEASKIMADPDARGEWCPPWIYRHPHLATTIESRQKILQMADDFLKDQQVLRKLKKANPMLGGEQFENAWRENCAMPFSEWVKFERYIRQLRFFHIEVSYEDNNLIFSDINPSDISIGLQAFLSYLEDLGCINIRYAVYQIT